MSLKERDIRPGKVLKIVENLKVVEEGPECKFQEFKFVFRDFRVRWDFSFFRRLGLE